MSAVEFLKFCISWGAYRKFHFWKKYFVCCLIHAVDISSCIYPYHKVVAGPTRVAHYGEFEVLPFIEFSFVGFNMIYDFNHIYPGWIGLSVSNLIYVGVIIFLGGCGKLNPLGGSLLALAHSVKMSYFVAILALGILCRTLLPQLVFMFPTSHALVLHPCLTNECLAIHPLLNLSHSLSGGNMRFLPSLSLLP